MDEQAMALWSHRFPEDTNEEQFFAQRRAKRREERADYREDKRTRKEIAKYCLELRSREEREKHKDVKVNFCSH